MGMAYFFSRQRSLEPTSTPGTVNGAGGQEEGVAIESPSLPKTCFLARSHTGLLARTEQLLIATKEEQSNEPSGDPSADGTDGRIADLIARIQDCARESEAARRSEKAPFDTKAKAVQAFFKERLLDPLAEARSELEDRLKAHLANRSTGASSVRGPEGAIITMQTDWQVTIDDPSALDLNQLKDCFGAGEIDKAARRFAQRTAGQVPMVGMTVTQTLKLTVR